jgi:uncharacterized protein
MGEPICTRLDLTSKFGLPVCHTFNCPTQLACFQRSKSDDTGFDGIRRTAMTPQEQQLVADLFDRLASLEDQRRDPDAERLIREGLGRAPNAVYALVQTALVQDEALKRANARIEELESAIAAPAESSGSFLDSVRNMISGRDQPRASVPSVQPGGMGSSGVWGPRPDDGQAQGYPPQSYPQGYSPPGYQQAGYPPAGPGAGGGSFLGTAAATVAGVVGGAMLLNGIRSMMGGHESHAGGLGSGGQSPGLPWGGSDDKGGGHLAQDAGLGDIGGARRAGAYDDSADSSGGGSFLGGSAADLAGESDDDIDDGDDDGDFDTA